MHISIRELLASLVITVAELDVAFGVYVRRNMIVTPHICLFELIILLLILF